MGQSNFMHITIKAGLVALLVFFGGFPPFAAIRRICKMALYYNENFKTKLLIFNRNLKHIAVLLLYYINKKPTAICVIRLIN